MTDTSPNSQELLHKGIAKLALSAQSEFDDAADYVWKAPRLVDHERKLELKKLDDYFPNPSEFRERRWEHESRKLEHTFPYMIAVGNVLSTVSLFESYLVLLANEVKPYTSVNLQAIKGRGVGRLFSYFRAVGAFPDRLSLWEQIQAAIKIRNCLAHASGMLDWSRDKDEIRRIHAHAIYLSPDHRRLRTERNRKPDEVVLGDSPLGERLGVTNKYAHLLCSYTRDYYIGLCNAVLTASTHRRR